MLKNYIAIARPDHWVKNIFVLPGVFFAAVFTGTPLILYAWQLFLGLICSCLLASANYVINEWLDANFDQYHPIKKQRPSVLGLIKPQIVTLEYVLLVISGLSIASLISWPFFAVGCFFLFMGIIYNIKPMRTKDRIIIDVLSESINNPIRMLLGWFIVTSILLPPVSLLVGYWMAGAFLMTVKRFSEYKSIGDVKIAGLYRRSFSFYNEEKLLLSIFFYAILASFLIGVFLIKHKIELIISVPFIIILFVWYLHVGFKKNSATQNPHNLLAEKSFLFYFIFTCFLVCFLSLVNVPGLVWFLNKAMLEIK